jgi:hypothetical protein
MKLIISLFITALLLASVSSQHCLNAHGQTVDWWVMLIYPGSISTGYAYFDSTFTTSTFQLNTVEPDVAGTPLYNTLHQINVLKMQAVAWNDEHPATNDGKNSTTKAHSKAVSAYDAGSNLGFLFDHSIPQYPAFNGSQINISIPTS